MSHTHREAKRIPLSKGKVAVVDAEDFEWLVQSKWFCGAVKYAQKCIGKRVKVYMHRLIVNAPDGYLVDHINGDTLDNRKSNLRLCSKAGNGRNRGPSTGRKFKGAYYDKRRQKWVAAISIIPMRQTFLGYFATQLEALEAYNKAAINHHGEFAWLNDLAALRAAGLRFKEEA